MTILTITRKALAAALEGAGFPVVDHEPDRPAPPQVIIALGTPALAPGETYSTRKATYRLLCTVRPGSASQVITALEAMVETVANVLSELDDVETWSASQPMSLLSGNDVIPCIEVTLTLTITT